SSAWIDTDWFRVFLEAGRTMSVDLRPPANLNYDVELYQDLNIFQPVASGKLGAGQTEHVTYTNTSSQTVTINIKVSGVNGAFSASSPYYLKTVW
ncbi:MAG TPA: hypothetical protein VM686_37265, partial [Polyangiaceae bacterium]|nr:hypothetical protein [Polyangiaceae bacterium]